MAKANKPTTEEQVADYYKQSDHPLLAVVKALEKIILETDPEIAEQIKWNSPAFYYTGAMKPFDPKEYKRDIVVFNLHKKDLILLVFPTGATIDDQTGLLGGKFPDGRKTVSFTALEEVTAKENDLKAVIKAWLDQVDK